MTEVVGSGKVVSFCLFLLPPLGLSLLLLGCCSLCHHEVERHRMLPPRDAPFEPDQTTDNHTPPTPTQAGASPPPCLHPFSDKPLLLASLCPLLLHPLVIIMARHYSSAMGSLPSLPTPHPPPPHQSTHTPHSTAPTQNMAEPDDLYTLRQEFYVGNFQVRKGGREGHGV